jgi:hypothetical protein
MTSYKNLVLCQSADGWSLHPPGSSDEDIATGKAAAFYLKAGPGEPTENDYKEAWEAWKERLATLIYCR